MLKDKLQNNELTVGTWLQINSTEVAGILARQNFEWLTIDAEHGLFNHTDIARISDIIQKEGKQSLVRLPECDSIWIRKALDCGVDGLIVPMVNTPEIARQAVKYSKYPPLGERGFGFSHANSYGKDFQKYVEDANRAQTLIAQIENITAVDQIDDILDVEGIDGVIIGPYDLAGSMGLVGQTDHPDVIAACQKVLTACKKKEIPAGMHVVKTEKAALDQAVDAGYKFIAYGMDSIFLQDLF